MQNLTIHRPSKLTERQRLPAELSRKRVKCYWVVLLGCALMFTACGGNSSNTGSPVQNIMTLTGNWQFIVANPPDGSFQGGIQGGFLLQTGGTGSGAVSYNVSLPGDSSPTGCNSGSAPVTGTIDGQNVTLTAVAGTQTFSLTGMMSLNGKSMAGTYSSTSGTATDGSACGTAQTGLQWSATLVPTVSGSFQGSFHSSGGTAGLNNQDFLVSGLLEQGINSGASNTDVTGFIGFANPLTLAGDDPCLIGATISGTISGNVVQLRMIGTDGSIVGQIGGLPGSGLGTVTLDSTQKGFVLHSLQGTAYSLSSKSCPSGDTPSRPGDSGSICIAVNGIAACQQAFTLTPTSLSFPKQALGTTSSAQTITITNTSSSILTGLALNFANNDGTANFSVDKDTCDVAGSSLGSTFDLNVQQSCVISIIFFPQETCPVGTASSSCPSPLAATLTLTSAVTVDNNTAFAIPITGTGIDDAVATSISRLDIVPQFSSRRVLSRPGFASGNEALAQAMPGSSDNTFRDVK